MRILTKKHISTLGVALAAFCLYSCGDEDVVKDLDVNSIGSSDKVEVSIDLGGELVPTVSDITRADEGNNDLYSILLDYPNSSYRYAYGVFDEEHIQDLKVTLDANTPYDIRATKIVDAKNVVYKTDYTYYENGQAIAAKRYDEPFSITEDKMNSFIYETSSRYTWWDAMPNDWVKLSQDGNRYQFAPNIDRYYGSIQGYLPSRDGDIKLEMLRVVFEIDFNVKNLSDDEILTISSETEYFRVIPTLNFTSDNPAQNIMFSYAELSYGYAQSIPLHYTWIKADGTTLEKDFYINVERLKTYTVNIELVNSYDNSAAITLEEGTFTDKGYVLDENGLNEKDDSTGE